jgi:hypothetical protein
MAIVCIPTSPVIPLVCGWKPSRRPLWPRCSRSTSRRGKASMAWPSISWRCGPRHQAAIRGILSNPVYTGQVYAGRLRSHPARQRRSALTLIRHRPGGRTKTLSDAWLLVAHVPPIVSQEQFDLVQTKLAHNQQLAMRHNTAHNYLLRCLVSCGLCRTSCRARTESLAYTYYYCAGARCTRFSRAAIRDAPRALSPPGNSMLWSGVLSVRSSPILNRLRRPCNEHKAAIGCPKNCKPAESSCARPRSPLTNNWNA